MSMIAWIVLGLIAGFIASKVVNKTGEDIVLDLGLGIVGAIVGGFVFNQFGAAGVTGFNLYSMLVALVGAVLVLVIYHLVTGRRAVTSHRPGKDEPATEPACSLRFGDGRFRRPRVARSPDGRPPAPGRRRSRRRACCRD